jgi:hypothetical protein
MLGKVMAGDRPVEISVKELARYEAVCERTRRLARRENLDFSLPGPKPGVGPTSTKTRRRFLRDCWALIPILDRHKDMCLCIYEGLNQMTMGWDTTRNTSGQITFSNGSPPVTATENLNDVSRWQPCYGLVSHSTGKWIYTVRMSADSGVIMAIGLGDINSVSIQGTSIGMESSDTHNTGYSPHYFSGWGFNGSANGVGGTFAAAGGTADIAVDFDNKRVWCRPNSSVNTWYGNISTGNPGNPSVSSTGFDISGLASNTLFPAATLGNSGDNVHFNSLTFVTSNTLAGFSDWWGGASPSGSGSLLGACEITLLGETVFVTL